MHLQEQYSNGTANGGINIKKEPKFFVKVEENKELFEIHHPILAGSGKVQNASNIDNEHQLQLNTLSSEKSQLISDLLQLKEDYDCVCEKLNEKDEELQNIQAILAEKNAKIDDLKLTLKRTKQMCDKLSRNSLYNVNKIVAHKKVNREWHFLIRWKNYGPESDTWEPKRNLFCEKMLDEYMKKENLNLNKNFAEKIY